MSNNTLASNLTAMLNSTLNSTLNSSTAMNTSSMLPNTTAPVANITPEVVFDWSTIVQYSDLNEKIDKASLSVRLIFSFVSSLWIFITYLGYTLVESTLTRPHNS